MAGNVVSYGQGGEREVGYGLGQRHRYACAAKHNIASIRVLQKCGFTICGEEITFSDDGGEPVEEVLLKLE